MTYRMTCTYLVTLLQTLTDRKSCSPGEITKTLPPRPEGLGLRPEGCRTRRWWETWWGGNKLRGINGIVIAVYIKWTSSFSKNQPWEVQTRQQTRLVERLEVTRSKVPDAESGPKSLGQRGEMVDSSQVHSPPTRSYRGQ